MAKPKRRMTKEMGENTLEHNDKPETTTDDTTSQNNTDEIAVMNGDEATSADEEIIADPAAQVAELEQKCAEERDRYLRAAAELDNFRKRTRRDIEDARHRSRAEIIEELLPAFDSIDMAMRSITVTDENKAVYEGLIMIKRQFLTAMDRFSLKEIPAKGLVFDPTVHEAVGYVPSTDVPTGNIIAESFTGYMLGDRLLRPTKVIVSSGPPEASADDASSPEVAEEATENTPGDAAPNDTPADTAPEASPDAPDTTAETE